MPLSNNLQELIKISVSINDLLYERAIGKGPINYELDLPKDIRLRYYILHISLLELAHPKTLIIITIYYRYEDLKEYKVDRILKRKD